MPGKRRSRAVPDWRAIASLGEQLADSGSLIAQRDRIISMTGRVLRGKIDVWLNEDLFRLPNRTEPRIFPAQPRSAAMRHALVKRSLYLHPTAKRDGRGSMAVPISEQGILLGAVQVTRARGPRFGAEERDLLQSIAGVVALGLYASHRAEVERFRLGELNLVRRVSAEIAAVLHLDELSRRVCELIQATFNYYYVGIFTVEPGQQTLRFRSSASAEQRGLRQPPLALDVQMGQGLIGKSALSGEIVQVADVRADGRFRFAERLPATRSEVVIPLKLEDRVLGVLDVQAAHVDAFHRNDIMLLEAIAGNVARAVESARLYGDLRRRADQLGLLADVGRSVTSTLELNKMMHEAAALIHDRFGFLQVSLFTVHPNRQLIEYEAGSGAWARSLPGYSIALDSARGLIPWVARESRTALVNDVSSDPRYRASPWSPKNTRSELAVPLVFGERTLGVMDIQSAKLNAFTEDDRLMFEAVAGPIAASIRNADLFRSEQWRRQVSDSLREVAGRLSQHIGTDEALSAILSELERNLPVDVAVIWLVAETGPYPAAVRGVSATSLQRTLAASVDMQEAFERILTSDTPVIRKASDPPEPAGKAAGFGREYSALTAPMRLGNQAVGMITLAHRQRGRYGHEAQGMAATFASYAAVAIENTRLFNASQEQAYASNAQLQVAEVVARPTDIHETLGSIVGLLPDLLDAKTSAVYGWDGVRRCYLPLAQSGLPDEAKPSLWGKEVQAGKFALLDAARKSCRTVVHVIHADEPPSIWGELRAARKIEAAMIAEEPLLIAAPVQIKSDTLGVLLVEEGGEPRRIRRRRFEIMQGVSQHIAMAMQADKLQHEMVARERLETEAQLARQIQRAFIPQVLPQIQGWELAARWETARQVGGDFYDVVELTGGRLGLFVADVSDKGMPAALFMALARTLFRAAVAEGAGPAEALRRINDLLIPDTRQGMFVTAVYAVLDPQTGEFTYANAGHNPPLLIRHGGAIREMERTAIALGVIEGSKVDQRTLTLGPGDSALLYTDGVTETFSPEGRLFGEEGLMETILGAQAESAEGLVAAVEGQLEAFRESSPLSDDLTMLAVHRQ